MANCPYRLLQISYALLFSFRYFSQFVFVLVSWYPFSALTLLVGVNGIWNAINPALAVPNGSPIGDLPELENMDY